jgi:hypothetical protein
LEIDQHENQNQPFWRHFASKTNDILKKKKNQRFRGIFDQN